MTDDRGFRAWLNRRGLVFGAGLAALAVPAFIWARGQMNPPTTPAPTHVYFVDEVSGEVVVEPANTIAPFPGKDGSPTLVRGVFYTLGADEEKRLAHLEKWADANLAAAAQTNPSIVPGASAILVRAPEPGSPWVRADSAEGEKVVSKLGAASSMPGFRVVSPH